MLYNDKRSHQNDSRRFGHFIMALTIIFLGFFYSSCKDDIVVITAKDSLTDPATQPKVVSTYPPNGGIGPFNIKNSYNDFSLPNFIITFNKMIDLTSITKNSIKVLELGSYSYITVQSTNYTNFTNTLYCNVNDSRFYPSTSFHAGKMYTVIVDTSVKDINGNHLKTIYKFSFIPKPTFEVNNINPDSGKENVSPTKSIVIVFNSPIDSSILNDIEFSPLVDYTTKIAYDSMSISLNPKENLLLNQNYFITIYVGAHDKYHTRLPRTYRSSFKTSKFILEFSNPYNNSNYVNTTSTMLLRFNSIVKSSTVPLSIVFNPPINAEYSINNTDINITPSSPLYEDSAYTLTILPTLESADNLSLDSTIIISFRTQKFVVNNFSPYDRQTDVSIYRGIQITCNSIIDTATIRSSFSISPPTSGTFQLSNNSNTFYFKPDRPLLPNRVYFFEISTNLQSLQGKKIVGKISSNFTTGH